AKGDAVRVSHAKGGTPSDAARLAQTAERFRRAEPPAVAHSSAGELFQSRRRFVGRRDRLESRIFALRLSGSGLFRAAPTFPASALRTAGFVGDGAKAEHATHDRAQDH